MQHKNRGFTIVELLIVIVVIAILAAISIVSYNGIQQRANNTVVANNLSSAAKSLALYHADNGQYPTTTVQAADLRTKYELVLNNTRKANTMLYCYDSANPQVYLLIAQGYTNNNTVEWTSSGVKNENAGFAIGSGSPTCQTRLGSTTASGLWATGFATVR